MSNKDSVVNFKLFAEVLIQDRLDKFQSGEIRIGVSNQHDEYVLESALENLNNDDIVEKAVLFYNDVNWNNITVMDMAHYHLSSFHPEPLSSSWVD